MKKRQPVLCTCQKCGNQWYYGGNNDYYATCPNCLRKVKVNREDEKE